MVGPTMNLISETNYSCVRREYAFMVLQEYTIISHEIDADLAIYDEDLNILGKKYGKGF